MFSDDGIYICKFFDVFDLADSYNGVCSQTGGDQKRLILKITDDTNGTLAFPFRKDRIKFCFELGVGNIMDAPF